MKVFEKRVTRMTAKSYGGRKGMSGLETAILVVSFIVVGSVFAYTVLSAGVFSPAKGEESVYAGGSADQGTSELRGSVLAYKGTTDGDDCITKVSFAVSTAMAGEESIDLTPPYYVESDGTLKRAASEPATLVSYNDSDTVISECAWTVEFSSGYQDDGDCLLEDSEKAIVTVWLQDYDGATGIWRNGAGADDPFIDDNSHHLGANSVFSIQLMPPAGPALLMEKRVPAYLSPVMRLN